MAPRNSHEPCSRDTSMVFLPCQPSPAAAASGFSITGAVSTKTLTSAPLCAGETRGELLQLALEDVVVVLALRVDGDGAARRMVQRLERIGFGRIAHAQHDDRAHIGPQTSRAAPPLGMRRHPLHVAVATGGKKFVEALAGGARGIGRCHAYGVKAERSRLAQQHLLERCGHRTAIRNRGWRSALRAARRRRGRPIACGTHAAT